MYTKATMPIIISTLCVNLFIGNYIVFAMNKGTTALSVHLVYSTISVLVLLWGFRLINPTFRSWHSWLLGVLCSLLIPFIGSFVLGFVTGIMDGAPLKAVGSGMVIAIFGLFFGAVLGIPLAIINAFAFFLCWHKSQDT